MDKETIDRLLIDRALGALEPDVEVLLDDYLAQNREIEKRFRATTEAVKLSRTLLRSEEKDALPSLRLPQEFVAPRRRVLPLRIIAAAASLFICFCIGRHFPGEASPVSRQSMTGDAAVEHSMPSDGMWTIARTRMRPKPPIRTTSWKWTSPVRQPEPVNKGEVL